MFLIFATATNEYFFNKIPPWNQHGLFFFFWYFWRREKNRCTNHTLFEQRATTEKSSSSSYKENDLEYSLFSLSMSLFSRIVFDTDVITASYWISENCSFKPRRQKKKTQQQQNKNLTAITIHTSVKQHHSRQRVILNLTHVTAILSTWLHEPSVFFKVLLCQSLCSFYLN